MYAGKSGSVPLPKVGHLHTLKNGYIYWEDGGKWDNERKQTIDSRVSIGKIDPNHEGMMFPNRNYFAIFDSANPPQPDVKASDKPDNPFSKTLN